jgi:hypothetical protein
LKVWRNPLKLSQMAKRVAVFEFHL